MNEVYYGTVIFFNKKNYGFIGWEKDGVAQKDLFVHYSDLVCEGYKIAYKGDKVSFEIGMNIRGQPKAINVKVIK